MSDSQSLVTTTPEDIIPLVKPEPSTPDVAVPLSTVTTLPLQYQPLLRATPVSIRPLPTLSSYGPGVPLSNFSNRLYRPAVIPAKDSMNDQSKGRKGRRKRTTPYQLAELLKVFQKNESPGYDVREELTGKVGMTNREVQVWFQNRRAKESNRAKRVEQVDANRPGLSHGYRKMSATSSGSDTSGSNDSSECNSLLSSSSSTTTLVNSETSVKSTSTHRPIKMAPMKNSFASIAPSLYSPFGRMAMAYAAPDGGFVFLQQPTFNEQPTVPTLFQGEPQKQQQQQQQQQQQEQQQQQQQQPPNSSCLQQQQQPFQFLPSPPTFFSSSGMTSNFSTQPQVMFVPVLMSPGSYPLNTLGGCTPVAHRGLGPLGADVVPRSVNFPVTTETKAKFNAAEKGARRTEVGNVEAEKEKYAEAANVLASLATA